VDLASIGLEADTIPERHLRFGQSTLPKQNIAESVMVDGAIRIEAEDPGMRNRPPSICIGSFAARLLSNNSASLRPIGPPSAHWHLRTKLKSRNGTVSEPT
jgi:hypothetical protein